MPTGAPTFDRGHAIGRLVAVTYGGGNAGYGDLNTARNERIKSKGCRAADDRKL